MATLAPQYAGTAIEITMRFTNAQRALVDPTVVTFTFQGGGEGDEPTTWTYGVDEEITKVAVGIYQVTVDTTVGDFGNPGTWTFQGQGTEACAVLNVTTLEILEPALA